MIGSRTSEATTDLIASPTAATTLSGHSVNRNFTFVTVVRTQNVDSKVDSGGGTMPDIRAQVGSACLKKTSIPAITPSPPSTNTIDCANVEGALESSDGAATSEARANNAGALIANHDYVPTGNRGTVIMYITMGKLSRYNSFSSDAYANVDRRLQ
ncbi:hypothetical protein LTR37_019946 [Vermiconidia calcicola]|uniref:Uncharacterized protein n=1 Tax=Vermiconidia calcicola TaxID=1690605 RepID=A0ACC3MCP2_9PEZI|nr:hypothetical protein LTR37_019946 [Vermiconidia calcicola]